MRKRKATMRQIEQLEKIIWRLEVWQQKLPDTADHSEINAIKDRLIKLLDRGCV